MFVRFVESFVEVVLDGIVDGRGLRCCDRRGKDCVKFDVDLENAEESILLGPKC